MSRQKPVPPWAQVRAYGLTPWELLQSIGLTQIPVDVGAVADRLGLRTEAITETPDDGDPPARDKLVYAGQGWPVIRYVAKGRTPEQIGFSVAYGISAAILHLRVGEPRTLIRGSRTREDAQANAYAVSLLIPTPVLQEEIVRYGRGPRFLAGLFGVPVGTMEVQLGRFDRGEDTPY